MDRETKNNFINFIVVNARECYADLTLSTVYLSKTNNVSTTSFVILLIC